MTDGRNGRAGAPGEGRRPGGAGSSPHPDRADFDPDHDPSDPIICELCGSEMFYTAACKIQCPNCGYKRDCSDP